MPKQQPPSRDVRSSRPTVGGAAEPREPASTDVLAEKVAATADLAAAFPFNPNKASEYDPAAAAAPPAGAFVKPQDPIAGSSTVSEANGSEKIGSGGAPIGENPLARSLDRVRVDSTARTLTTNQGVPVADNQSSLKAGLRGPTLLEDFILREKITHFDHERIPERIVHARGSAAHGYFECYKPLTQFTRASLFAEAGKQTPVFVRFSTVLGERGSTDTARDVRGFAVKFYTDEGNWDLVGNNIPVFFIQDAMKFPDLVHAAKPEPHFGMPQAGTAHDTFWDFASLMPEITHMLMWAMSDRAIPAKLPDDAGVRRPHLPARQRRRRVALRQVPLEPDGRDALAGVGRSGQDLRRRFRLPPPRPVGSDRGGRLSRVGAGRADLHRGTGRGFHLRRPRRDEDRAGGARAGVPGRQARPEPQPRQLLRRDRAGRVLRRARRAGHRLHQRSAARRPHPLVRRHADLAARRRRTSTRSRSTRRSRRCTTTSATACTARPSTAAASPTSRTRSAAAVRSRPGRRASSRSRSRARPTTTRCAASRSASPTTTPRRRLFWNSQTPVEKTHIIKAFRFELSRVQTPAIRERMVSGLLNVAPELAEAVAKGLGIRELPAPMPKVLAGRRHARRSPRRRRCRCSRGPATAASGRGGSRSWSPTAATASAVRALAEPAGRRRRGAALRWPALGAVEAHVGRAARRRRLDRNDARRRSTTRSSCRTATRRPKRCRRTGRRSSS